MSRFRAALAVAVVVFGANAPARAAEPLQLEDAFQRVVETHPELSVLRYTQAGLAAEAERAALSPPLTAALSAENALGTGAASGVNGVELTLSLASVLERGGKRAARLAVADRRYEAVEMLREAKRLDVLAEVARRYLDVAAAQSNERIAREDLAQRTRTVAAATKRVSAGASPESVRFAAEAAQARAAGDLARTQRAQVNGKRRLATLWGDATADFDVVAGDLAVVPSVASHDELVRLLERTPELRRFAHEARLREARIQLARAARTPDVQWEVGIRRLEAGDDWGFVGTVSIPLGASTRAGPEIRAAEAELASLEFERDAELLRLEATLSEAWGQLDAAASEASHIERELLPRLLRAEAAAERAYRAGAVSYLEWAQLQSETTAARRAQLEASLRAHRALIELQRLTGEPLLIVGASKEQTP